MAKRKRKTNRQRMLRRWQQNQHCFWCGVITVWVDDVKGTPPDEMATIDHIRSRWCENRTENGDKWWPGIWVLSCYRCNNERAAMEQAWCHQTKPDEFYGRGNGKPAKKDIPQTQQKVATALLSFVRAGGELVGPKKRVGQLKRFSRRLQRLYDDHKREVG